jgi:N-acetylglutamate synthase-like GNAT family acetyltransferase
MRAGPFRANARLLGGRCELHAQAYLIAHSWLPPMIVSAPVQALDVIGFVVGLAARLHTLGLLGPMLAAAQRLALAGAWLALGVATDFGLGIGQITLALAAPRSRSLCNGRAKPHSGSDRGTMTAHLRTMRPDDLPAVNALLRLAYRNENNYLSRLRRQLALEPEGWLVAEREGALAGVGGVTVMGAVGYIGLVGVDPACQRQGIASALMEALIVWAQAQGCVTILLDASDMGKPLYLGMGFVVEDIVTVRRRAPDAPRPLAFTPRAMLQPYHERDLPAIIAFDAACYGAPRDCVVAAYIADDPRRVSVARDQTGAVSGYLVVQEASQMAGPWLASSHEAAWTLLMGALARWPGAIEAVMAPGANQHAANMLSGAGFTPFRELAHMRLGEPLAPTRRQMVYGQVSLALG